jgi:hypothetical protein
MRLPIVGGVMLAQTSLVASLVCQPLIDKRYRSQPTLKFEGTVDVDVLLCEGFRFSFEKKMAESTMFAGMPIVGPPVFFRSNHVGVPLIAVI